VIVLAAGVTRSQIRFCTMSMIIPTTIRMDTLRSSCRKEPQASCHEA